MFAKYFTKQADGTYDIVRKSSAYIDEEFTEAFDMNKLAAACLKKDHIDRLIRSEARNMLPIEKYLSAHVEYRAQSVTKTNFKVEYTQNDTLYGRAQANGAISMQSMVREVRHFIAHQQCTDVDMSNAHPVLTLWICNELGIECPVLREYVTNRAGKIDDIVQHAAEHGQTTAESEKGAIPIDKAFVKYYLLAIVYGCGSGRIDRIKYRHPWIKAFKDEMDSIASKICRAFPKLYQDNKNRKIEQGKAYNFESSTMSHLCQYAENRVLMDMLDVLYDLNETAPYHSALCFDGIMIENGLVDFNEFIQECQKQITIPLFKLEIKDMSSMHDLVAKSIKYSPKTDYVEKYLKRQYDEEKKRYKDKIKTFGRRSHRAYIEDLTGRVWPSYELLRSAAVQNANAHMATMSGLRRGQYLLKLEPTKVPKESPIHEKGLLYWCVDKRHKDPEPQIKKISSIALFADLTEEVNAYDNTMYRPINHGCNDQCPEGILNTYPGFRAQYVEDIDMELVDPWLNHLKTVFCASSEDAFDWLMEWLHRAMARPDTVTRKVLVFKSTEHQIAGKGFFWRRFLYELVYGEQLATKQTGVEWVSERFNSTLEHTLLHICEEAKTVFDPNQGMRDYSMLKDLSGGEEILIEEKGKDKRKASAYGNIVVLSNEENVVNIEQEDMRIAMFECDVSTVKQIGCETYYTNLAKLLTQESANAFYSYCINYKSKCDFSKIPMTDIRERVLEHSKNPAQLFCDALESISNDDSFDCEGWRCTASLLAKPYNATELYKCFVQFSKENCITDISQRKFGQYMTTTKYIKSKTRNGYVYTMRD